MNLQQLTVFAVAARCRTLTEAAQELGLSQPTVTFHLRKLEEEHGVELFKKYYRQLRLTDAGEALLPYARRVAALCRDASSLMSDYRDQRVGTLRLGSSYTPATYWLPEVLSAFRRERPGVRVQMTVKKAESITELVKSGELDLGIVSDTVSDDPELIASPLLEDDLLLLFAPDHPLAGKEPLTVDDLRDEPFLLHEVGATSRRLAELWAEENGLKLRVVMELGAIETIKESVRCGIGVGILPRRSVQREAERGEVVMRELPNGVNRRYVCLIHHADASLPPVARTFYRFVSEWATMQNAAITGEKRSVLAKTGHSALITE
ncbi:LysR family transcriptional regulator [Paenibacillus sp. TRM 82003]|nr:LysR family transcriptional regulator [Paenibacillus sp. TRM 82003]